MTLCIGVTTRKGVWIGIDSGSSGNEATISVPEPKMFRANGWLVGCCGDWRVIDVIKYAVNFPDIGNNPHKALCTELNSELITRFKEHDIEIKLPGDDDGTGSEYEMLISDGEKLWYVDQTGHAEQHRTSAIGSGEEYALGLIDGSNIDDPVLKIKEAFKTTAHRYRAIISPFRIEKA